MCTQHTIIFCVCYFTIFFHDQNGLRWNSIRIPLFSLAQLITFINKNSYGYWESHQHFFESICTSAQSTKRGQTTQWKEARNVKKMRKTFKGECNSGMQKAAWWKWFLFFFYRVPTICKFSFQTLLLFSEHCSLSPSVTKTFRCKKEKLNKCHFVMWYIFFISFFLSSRCDEEMKWVQRKRYSLWIININAFFPVHAHTFLKIYWLYTS